MTALTTLANLDDAGEDLPPDMSVPPGALGVVVAGAARMDLPELRFMMVAAAMLDDMRGLADDPEARARAVGWLYDRYGVTDGD